MLCSGRPLPLREFRRADGDPPLSTNTPADGGTAAHSREINAIAVADIRSRDYIVSSFVVQTPGWLQKRWCTTTALRLWQQLQFASSFSDKPLTLVIPLSLLQ